MKKMRTEDSVGRVLCHDITEMRDGFKGAAFKRGHVIEEKDISKLLDLGKKHIFIWEENVGEIHEEDAAIRLRTMAPVEGAHYTDPSEGKVLLIADQDGMFRVNKELLQKVNSIGDITIATLPDHYPVKAGARLASMRIVPLVTKEQQIIDAEELCKKELCKGKKLLDLRSYQQKKAGVIITGSEIYSGRIKDKFEPVVRGKLKNYPCKILGVTICDDDLKMMCGAAKAFLDLGADIVTHGVPSQSGNMTLIAYLAEVAILGVPGAVISLPTTIFDVVLPQVFAGDKFTKEELIGLGEGGLCQLCSVCHFPNCTFGRY